MIKNIPRLMFAAPSSGSGKTTVTCAVLSALINRGLKLSSFKSGPDYIDPMFHRKVLGLPACNLDLFLCGEEAIRQLMAENAAAADLAIIEGAMGLYDGLRGTTDEGSANHLSRVLDAPVVLVADVKGMGLSAAALIHGFLHYKENRIRGVILNRCSKGMYPVYKEAIESLGVRVLGYLPVLPEVSLESRHLGLVTASEVDRLQEKLDFLGKKAAETVDLDGLLEIAQSASPIQFSDAFYAGLEPVKNSPVIAVAKDRAFCFYYEECLRLLERLGARLVEFSPLRDPVLPEADGLWLGGGYPEEYGEALAKNVSMRNSVAKAVAEGMPTVAECGGFLYLLEGLAGRDGKMWPMAGVLPGKATMTERLQHFGYAFLEAKTDNLLCMAGEKLTVHEFHYSQSDCEGNDFVSVKGNRCRECAYGTSTLYAGYPHMHFYGNLKAAERFVHACGSYQAQKEQ